MPGNIHVSVQEFSDLPSSSSPSSILVKTTMGKKEYRTRGKGDFSLPLTSLRDNMCITLHNAEGKEISKTVLGVQTITIVEKGSLDESLALEGGGIVHLKLQFVLSEDDRNKIRRLRESATKRKRDELLASRTIPSAYSCNNHEVSGVSSRNDVLNVGDQASATNQQHGTREVVETHTKEINIPDGRYANENCSLPTFISEAVNKHLGDGNDYKSDKNTETSAENDRRPVEENKRLRNVNRDKTDEEIENNEENRRRPVEENVDEVHQFDHPKTPVILEKVFDKSQIKSDEKVEANDENYRRLVEENVKTPVTLEPLRNTSSDVVKMDRKDANKVASSLISISRGSDVHLVDENFNQSNEKIENSEEQIRLVEKNEIKLDLSDLPKRPFIKENVSSNLKKNIASFEVKKHQATQAQKRKSLQNTPKNVKRMISAFETNLFKERRPGIKPPPTKPQLDKLEQEIEGLDSKDINKLLDASSDEVKSPFITEKLKPSELENLETEKHITPSSMEPTQATEIESIPSIKKGKSEEDLVQMSPIEEKTADISDLKRPESVICSSNSHETTIEKSCEREQSYESSGPWIFPDEGKPVCITTETKQVIEIEEMANDVIQRFSSSENVEKNTRKSGIYKEVNKSAITKSSTGNSSGAETSSGPFGQVIKIAAMVAFGSLVLLTRQRR